MDTGDLQGGRWDPAVVKLLFQQGWGDAPQQDEECSMLAASTL